MMNEENIIEILKRRAQMGLHEDIIQRITRDLQYKVGSTIPAQITIIVEEQVSHDVTVRECDLKGIFEFVKPDQAYPPIFVMTNTQYATFLLRWKI